MIMLVGITGSRGFLGRAIASRLTSVREISRERYGDLLNADPATLVAGCDAIINCAALIHVPNASEESHRAMNTHFPLSLALAAKASGVRRFVQISSVAALTSNGEGINDLTEPQPQTPYGRAKLAADQALAELDDKHFSVASMRPPTIFGPGVGAWFAKFNSAARKGVPLPLGKVHNRRSFAFVENIADAVVKCLNSDRSGAWIVSDSEPISSADMYRSLLALHGYGDRVISLPERLAKACLKAILRDRAESLLGDASYDGSQFAKTFDWSPRFNRSEALEATVAT